MRVLIIEDGYEYIETLERFLGDPFDWTRAGNGPQALEMLSVESFDAIYLDMRFDRIGPSELFGDLVATADRFNDDPVQARQFLEDHQGTYILSALRSSGNRTPVLLSYDFGAEPRRWRGLAMAHSPVDYLPDNAGPNEVARRLEALVAR